MVETLWLLVFTLKTHFEKKFRSMTLLLHMMTSSRKMTVQILRSNPCWSRKHEMPIKSCLSKIFTWNFHTMLFMRWVIHYKWKLLFYLRSSLFFNCSLLFSNNETKGANARKTDLYRWLFSATKRRMTMMFFSAHLTWKQDVKLVKHLDKIDLVYFLT